MLAARYSLLAHSQRARADPLCARRRSKERRQRTHKVLTAYHARRALPVPVHDCHFSLRRRGLGATCAEGGQSFQQLARGTGLDRILGHACGIDGRSSLTEHFEH